MTIDFPKLVPWFDALANGVMQVAAFLPETGRPVAATVAVALRYASDLAAKGLNPVEHIERLHSADEALQDIEQGWANRIRTKFEGV